MGQRLLAVPKGERLHSLSRPPALLQAQAVRQPCAACMGPAWPNNGHMHADDQQALASHCARAAPQKLPLCAAGGRGAWLDHAPRQGAAQRARALQRQQDGAGRRCCWAGRGGPAGPEQPARWQAGGQAGQDALWQGETGAVSADELSGLAFHPCRRTVGGDVPGLASLLQLRLFSSVSPGPSSVKQGAVLLGARPWTSQRPEMGGAFLAHAPSCPSCTAQLLRQACHTACCWSAGAAAHVQISNSASCKVWRRTDHLFAQAHADE